MTDGVRNPLNGAVEALLTDTVGEDRSVLIAVGFLAGLDLGYRYPEFARQAMGIMDNTEARRDGRSPEIHERIRRAEGDDLMRLIREYR